MKRALWWKRSWLQIFASGLVLLYVLQRALGASASPAYLPGVILLGAFLVPVTFVAYLHDRLEGWRVPQRIVAACFLWGGILGTVVASHAELGMLRHFGVMPSLGIALIEESVKLVIPVVVYVLWRERSRAAGIVIGLATGAGFAGFETMGYAYVRFLQSHGDLGLLNQILFLRGLTSPVGHIAWTGLVCAVLWGEGVKAGRATINPRVLLAFSAAVALHTLWDASARLAGDLQPAFSALGLVNLIVAVASLALLAAQVDAADRP